MKEIDQITAGLGDPRRRLIPSHSMKREKKAGAPIWVTKDYAKADDQQIETGKL